MGKEEYLGELLFISSELDEALGLAQSLEMNEEFNVDGIVELIEMIENATSFCNELCDSM